MRWTADALAMATGGTLSGPSVLIAGLSVDSRRLRPGEAFVAIVAERDGHRFVGSARDAGAAAVVVSRPVEEANELPQLMVADTGTALLDVGRAARRRLDAQVVGITGSVGKTTVKDLAAAALATSRRSVASERSFNNELGVPLTLANAAEDTEVVVLEMGARGRGHIALLCEVALPSIGVVTSVTAAHTELFGGLTEVAEAKGELVEALPPTGTAILNADDPLVLAMRARTSADVLTFSSAAAPADVVAEDISLDAELRASFVVRSPWGTTRVGLEARGAHQVANALAALAVAGRCGVEISRAAEALATATMSPWRMQLERTREGASVINDSYNANPASMTAALRALAALPAARRVAVLGPMAELGSESHDEHRAIARLAADLGVEVIALGTDDYGIPATADFDDAIVRIGELDTGVAVLVKASRVAGLDRLAARLLSG